MESPELVTVYRSMDESAKQDCATLVEVLAAEGLSPLVVDDTAPGVPAGVYELRVPANQALKAEEVIEANPLPDEVDTVDDAPELELETIYHSEGSSTAEMEAMAVQSILEAGGIATVVVGDAVLPNLPFEVRVAKEHADSAKQLLAEAIRNGPAAAEEAELLTERREPLD